MNNIETSKLVKIVADSTGRIPEEIRKKHDISIVNLFLNYRNKDGKVIKSVKDDYSVNIADFVRDMSDKTLNIATSAPAPGDFTKAYKEAEGRQTLVIHLGGEISKGTRQAAKTAKELGGFNNVEFFDTGTVCLTGGQVINAAIMAQEGKTIKEIVKYLKDIKDRSVLYVALDNLDALRRSGRVSGIQDMFAKMLGKNLILEVRNLDLAGHEPEKYATVWGMDKAEELIKNIPLSLEPIEVSMFHGGDEEYEKIAEEMAEDIRQRTHGKIKVSCSIADPVLTTHTGTQVVAAGIISKNPIPEKVIYNKAKKFDFISLSSI